MMIYPEVTPMPIENYVRTYRISHHDTQQDLAAAVGVNEKTISFDLKHFQYSL